jgi:XTP/dITP diphosphohydrolase
MKKLFLATGNEGKIKEMRKLLADLEVEIVTSKEIGEIPEVVEDGETLRENAIKKAKEVADYTDLATIADDTGLIVNVLDAKPGVYSARYAGINATDEDNNQKLLKELAEVSQKERKAYFKTVIALINPDGKLKTVEGICKGYITNQPMGENGFGYDPLFIPEGYDSSFAQLSSEEKNKISHRAKALNKMKEYLKSNF